MASQKQRYEVKVQEISDTIRAKYKLKIEECVKTWTSDVGKKDALIKEMKVNFEKLNKEISEQKEKAQKFEDNYSIAKNKIGQLCDIINQHEEDIKSLKKTIELLEAKVHELENRPTSEKLFNENQSLQSEVKKLRLETKRLNFQNNAADRKNHELQKSCKSASALSANKDNDGFILPSQKNTLGRTRASKTQSEVCIARRPPQGTGSLFAMNEEDGEMFSNSYLSDMKDGICSIESGRISELARRNTMQPAHLKSSYPAETQFRPTAEFMDEDLKNGRIELLKGATAHFNTDSPAKNTRSKSAPKKSKKEAINNFGHSKAKKSSFIYGTPPHTFDLRTRKRQSLNKSDVENEDLIKRPKMEMPSYKSESSSNNSKIYDKTPLQESTNSVRSYKR